MSAREIMLFAERFCADRQQDLKNQLDQAEAQVSQATAQHVQAGQDYERAKALYATQSLTRPDFDQAQAKFASTLAVVTRPTPFFTKPNWL